MKKDRRTAPDYKRRPAYKDIKESFLIICEGENTEPEYFKAFKLTTAHVKAIGNMNKANALFFVREAIRYKKQHADYDHCWVVFDMDQNSVQDFNDAITLAKKEGFDVAYSNQSFELWYLLHFKYSHGKIYRKDFKQKIDKYLPFKYDKDKAIAKKMFGTLINKQNDAIENAKKLYDFVGDHSNPANEESSTTVFQLVEALNKFL
jgi:hypothetical protein